MDYRELTSRNDLLRAAELRVTKSQKKRKRGGRQILLDFIDFYLTKLLLIALIGGRIRIGVYGHTDTRTRYHSNNYTNFG